MAHNSNSGIILSLDDLVSKFALRNDAIFRHVSEVATNNFD